MALRFVSKVHIRFYPLHSFALTPRVFWKNVTTPKAKLSSPGCDIQCFISPTYVDPEISVTFIDGTMQIFDSKTMNSDQVHKEMKRVQDRIELVSLIDEMDNTPDDDFTQYIAPVEKDKKKR